MLKTLCLSAAITFTASVFSQADELVGGEAVDVMARGTVLGSSFVSAGTASAWYVLVDRRGTLFNCVVALSPNERGTLIEPATPVCFSPDQ